MKTKLFNKKYLKSIETDDLKYELYDWLGIDIDNDEPIPDFTIIYANGKGYTLNEGYPINIHELKKMVNELIELGCTHIEISNHIDHRTYLIDGINFYDADNDDYKQALETKKQVLIEKKRKIEETLKANIGVIEKEINEIIEEQKF